MSGKRYLLDTNAIIQFLAGNAEVSGIVENNCTVVSADSHFIHQDLVKVQSYQVQPNDAPH